MVHLSLAGCKRRLGHRNLKIAEFSGQLTTYMAARQCYAKLGLSICMNTFDVFSQ